MKRLIVSVDVRRHCVKCGHTIRPEVNNQMVMTIKRAHSGGTNRYLTEHVKGECK